MHTQPPSLASSRRVKQEQRTLVRQTALFLILAIIGMVIFFAVILPAVIRWVTQYNSSPSTNIETGVKPLQPVLNAPVEATTSAQLTVSGFAQPKMTIIILNNNNRTGEVTTLPDGGFSTEIELVKGDNLIQAYAKSEDLQESDLSQEFRVVFDTDPPKIVIDEPANNASIQGKVNQTITIKGGTKPGSKLSINGRLVFPKEDGTFEIPFRLENGENGIVLKAIDAAGNTTENKLTITFRE